MRTFHHAYNGIPTRRGGAPFFKDGEPATLDHLARDTYSGTLKLTIEVETPLITAWRDPNGRLVVPSASGEKKGALTDDDAIIPASSLKGVLSSAYEEVTQSRFRVFDNDERRPQFRYTTDHPQRWQNNDIPPWKHGFLRVKDGDEGPEWSIYLQQCALLPDSSDAEVDFTGTREGESVDDLLTRLRLRTPHLSQVASFEAFKPERPKREKRGPKQKPEQGTKLVVSKIEDINICTSKSPEEAGLQYIQCRGYVVRLTNVPESGILTDDDRLIKTKHNEYIFYTNTAAPKPRRIHPDEINPFVATILEAARIAIPYYLKNKKARHTLIDSAIRHIENEFGDIQNKSALTTESIYKFLLSAAGHEPGVPVFVRRRSNDQWEMAFSQLGRSTTPGSLSPSQLAERGNIYPARSVAEASAADRLWGFVTQDPSDDVSAALKGRIYLTNAHLQSQEDKTYLQRAETGKGWIPPILAGPKPWTAQPYLRSTDGLGIFDTERSECFTDQHSLIRKTYPTHRFLLSHGRQPFFSGRGTSRKPTSSEVLIGSYVNSGAVFESTLRFEGLTAKEISTILWLLTPENLVPKSAQKTDEKGYFHLGLGKPLGLGTASISAEILFLQDSQSLADGYKDLNTVLCQNICEDSNDDGKTTNEIPESISRALPDAIKEHSSPAVRAFVRSAYGWKEDQDKNLKRDPVSYTPYPDSEKKSPIIDYFKDYEQKRIKGETQDFSFRMRTLEETDNEYTSASYPTATVSSTQVQQTPRSNATHNTSSTPKGKGPVPPPGPGPYQVPRH